MLCTGTEQEEHYHVISTCLCISPKTLRGSMEQSHIQKIYAEYASVGDAFQFVYCI